jgi:hypothetical protein
MAMDGVGFSARSGKQFETEVDEDDKKNPPEIRSAFGALPNDVLRYLADFVAGKPIALVRLATTCKGLKNALDPYVQQYAQLDRSRKVSSLQSFLTLLEYGKTAPKQFVFEGKLRPFREELLATLGNRILALPAEEREQACEAFIAALKQYDAEQTGTLKRALYAANKGVPHMELVEQAAVSSSLLSCGACENLPALQEIAAQFGVCSPEGLHKMKLEAAYKAVSRGMDRQQAAKRFDVPVDRLQEQLEPDDDDFGLRWTETFFE